jgi:hypothetical protein
MSPQVVEPLFGDPFLELPLDVPGIRSSLTLDALVLVGFTHQAASSLVLRSVSLVVGHREKK